MLKILRSNKLRSRCTTRLENIIIILLIIALGFITGYSSYTLYRFNKALYADLPFDLCIKFAVTGDL